MKFEDFIQNANKIPLNSKRLVSIKCEICGQEDNIQCRNLLSRIYAKNKQICKKCIGKYVTSTPEWKKQASIRQTEVQNRPELKEKQRRIQFLKRLQEEDYVEKRCKQPNRLYGTYKNKKFFSSYELSYLICNEEAQNCFDMKINYIYNNSPHIYTPDFKYIENGVVNIVEIKGFIPKKQVECTQYKTRAGEKYAKAINGNYYFLTKNELSKLNNFVFYDTFDKVVNLMLVNEDVKIDNVPSGWLKTNKLKNMQDFNNYINNKKYKLKNTIKTALLNCGFPPSNIMPIDLKDVVLFDTETTGKYADKDEILELAIIDGLGNVLMNKRFKPVKHETWEGAENVHHISPKDVKNCKPISHYAKEIKDIFSRYKYISGYNVDHYDLPILKNNNIDVVDYNKHMILDIISPFKDVYKETFLDGEFKLTSLTNCAKFFEYKWTGQAHGALADTYASLHCFKKMIECL